MRNGNDILCSGYVLYGSSVHLLFTTRGGTVNGFTLDPAIGEFILTHPDIRIPKKGNYYSINEGNTLFWYPEIKEYVDKKKFPENKKPYSARYIGSMVADVHRTLLYGGIFLYPSDTKSTSGKLRVLYEVFPMAFILE